MIVLYVFLGLLSLIFYTSIAVAEEERVRRRFPDPDCRNHGGHLPRHSEIKTGLFCACRAWSVWAGIFWPFVLVWVVPRKIGKRLAGRTPLTSRELEALEREAGLR